MFYRGFSEGFECFGRDYMHSSWLGLIGVLVFTAVAVLVVILLFKRSKNNTISIANEKLEMLYVKGEITEEEFLRRKKLLGNK